MNLLCLAERLEGRRLLASGDPDPAFGTNGVVSGYSEIVGGGALEAIAVQPDGKVIAAGGTGDFIPNFSNPKFFSSTSRFALVRLLASGSLDTTFGTDGTETAAPMPYSYIQSVALQSDGKIVVAGSGGADVNDSHIIIGRFNIDGSPDTTFGASGFVTATIRDYDTVSGLGLAPDGKIVVLADGATNTSTSTTTGAVLRYTQNGVLDPSFGAAGTTFVFINTDVLGPSVNAMAIDKTGAVFVEADGYVEKLTPDGSPDAHFGTGGVTQEVPQDGFTGVASSIGIQPDGHIAIVGRGSASNGANEVLATRFTSSGARDKAFGKKGWTAVTLQDRTGLLPQYFNSNATPVGLAIGRRGNLIIGAYVNQFGLDAAEPIDAARFAAVQLTVNGRLDRSFGSGGTLQLGTGNLWPTVYNYPAAIATSTDGSIVLAGTSFKGQIDSIGSDGFELVKLTQHGVLDSRFGYAGRAGPFPKAPPAQVAAIQPDRKVLFATANSLARLLPDGSLDPSFGKAGLALDPNDFVDDNSKGITSTPKYLTTLANGDILAAYSVAFSILNDNNSDQIYDQICTELRRFHADGSPDKSFGVRRLAVPQQAPANPYLDFDALAVQPDGKIVLVSTALNSNAVIVTRYTQSGALDRSFGTHGATTLRPFGATSVTISRIGFDKGSIVLGGIGSIAAATDPNTQSELVVISLDDHGHQTSENSALALSGNAALLDMTVSDGGFGYILIQDSAGLALYKRNFDPSFGKAGRVTPQMPPNFAANSPFFIQPDGAIVGFLAPTLSPVPTVLAGFTSAGILNTNFGAQGIATPPIFPGLVARAPDGTMILAEPLDNLVFQDASTDAIVRLLG